MKKKYVKPKIEIIDIITNDLCAGSVCSTIDLKVIDLKRKQEKTYVFGRGDTRDKWDSKF